MPLALSFKLFQAWYSL